MLRTRAESIVFPPYELDLTSGRLLRDGQPVGLPPKALGVLRHMAERPGRLVTKQELLKTVWPNVYVGEQVLKVQIAEIRKALADTCREPRFIETAHRRGYRFIAPTRGGSVRSEQAVPPTRYARNGDVNIAYQIVGEGDSDLVLVMSGVSHLDYMWTDPSFARFLRRLLEFSRLIVFDQRGTGLSDRISAAALPGFEERLSDVAAVMESANSKRATLSAIGDAAGLAIGFAGTYPDRTAGLVLISPVLRRPGATCEVDGDQLIDQWGGPIGIEKLAPSRASDPEFRRWWSGYLRTSASPAAAVAMQKMQLAEEVTDGLPSVQAPVLVLRRSGDRVCCAADARWIADQIPQAEFREVPGIDHLPFLGDSDALVTEVETFVTSRRYAACATPVTVMVASFPSRPAEVFPGGRHWQRFRDHVTREVEWHRPDALEDRGESFCAVFDEAARALRCASSIGFYARRYSVPFTAGLHFSRQVAEQIEEQAAPGQILLSEQVQSLLSGTDLARQICNKVSRPLQTQPGTEMYVFTNS